MTSVVMATNRFYFKTKLAAGSQEVKRWNAAVRLYSVRFNGTDTSFHRTYF